MVAGAEHWITGPGAESRQEAPPQLAGKLCYATQGPLAHGARALLAGLSGPGWREEQLHGIRHSAGARLSFSPSGLKSGFWTLGSGTCGRAGLIPGRAPTGLITGYHSRHSSVAGPSTRDVLGLKNSFNSSPSDQPTDLRIRFLRHHEWMALTFPHRLVHVHADGRFLLLPSLNSAPNSLGLTATATALNKLHLAI